MDPTISLAVVCRPGRRHHDWKPARSHDPSRAYERRLYRKMPVSVGQHCMCSTQALQMTPCGTTTGRSVEARVKYKGLVTSQCQETALRAPSARTRLPEEVLPMDADPACPAAHQRNAQLCLRRIRFDRMLVKAGARRADKAAQI